MHIVVIGAGRIGVAVARWLLSAGHEIAVVETDHERCTQLDDAVGSVSVHGSGTDVAVLARAGANRADVVIATTSADDVNLVTCQLAKHHFGAARTMSLVHNSEHTELFGMAGIDSSVDMTELALAKVQEGLSSQGLVHLMPVSGRDGESIVNIKIPADSAARERRVRELSLPSGTTLSLIITRSGGASIPTDDTIIKGGDELIAVTSVEHEDELRDIFSWGADE
jgi:trk system potassium uptake protein TrkA